MARRPPQATSLFGDDEERCMIPSVASPRLACGKPKGHDGVHGDWVPNPHAPVRPPRPPADGPTVQDAARAVAAGVEGADRADHHADPEWKSLAWDAIIRTARTCPEFTSDEVWTVGGCPPTSENRALGPLMTKASRDGIIVDTGRTTRTKQVRSHASPARIWASTIYVGPWLPVPEPSEGE